MKDALRSANYHLERVPQLVPLHANHYLPQAAAPPGILCCRCIRRT